MVKLPTDQEIDRAVPANATPHRGRTNEVLKRLRAHSQQEAQARVTAIQSLQQSINDETQGRIAADQALQQQIDVLSGEAASVLMQKQVIESDLAIPTGYNALVFGDIILADGVTVTVEGTATLRGL